MAVVVNPGLDRSGCFLQYDLAVTMAASSPQAMILRVVETDRFRKLKLRSRTASVDALIDIMKEKLEHHIDFSLQYEDPDFNGKLTSLVDIEELNIY
ncbi:hypothetical protein QTP86_026654 [Hemibagrus guttatus]|nr:hypothetical protein QTP86_026654 [Hemibagrus guttatus]